MSKQIYKILIVDDNAEDRVTFRYFLQKDGEFGYEFLEAELGEAGIEICLAEKPDCVLLDYNLPDSDGLAVLEAINPDPLDPVFPVILLTGVGDESLAVKAMKQGAQDYLVKGELSYRELHRAVHSAMEIVNLRRKHRTSENELRESQQHLSAILRQTAVGICQTDMKGRYVLVNDKFCELVGRTREELLTLHLQDITHPEDLQSNLEMIGSMREGLPSFVIEKRYIRPDDSIVWVSSSVSFIYDADGNALFGLGAMQDVTTRKIAEENLRASEAFLSLGVQVSAFGICRIDYIAGTNHLSKEAAALFGLGDEAMIVSRDAIHTTFHPQDAAELARLIEQSLNPDSDGWFACEHRIVLKNGDVRWLNVRKQIFFDRTQSPPRPVRGIMAARDITAQKNSQEKLEISEERLSLAMKGAQIGTFDWNIKTGEIQWSREIEEATAISPDDFDNSFEGLLNFIHPPDREMLQLCIEEAFKTGEYECEFRILKGDGTIRWVIGKGSVFYDENGEPARLLGVDIDITKRKIAEQELVENQRFTESIIETAPSVLYTFNLETHSPTYLTKQGANSLGYEYDELKDSQAEIFRRLLHPDDVKSAIEHFENIKQKNNNDIFEIEYRMQHKSGEWRWFRSRDRVFKRDENGAAEEVLGIALDITERRRAEENLRRSEEFNRLVLESSPDCVKILDDEGRLEYMNANGQCLMEIDDFAPFSNRFWWDMWEEKDRMLIKNSVGAALEGKTANFQALRPTAEGTPKWWDIIVAPVARGADNTKKIISVSRDITERKQAEEHLRRNHETFFNLIKNTPFGIYIIDADFCLIQISKGAQKFFSTIDPLIGRDFAEIIRILREEPFASNVTEIFRHTLLTGEPYRSRNTTEPRGDTDNVESYDWKIERIILPDGRFGVVCYFYDLTELLQFEEQLRESEKQLRLVLNAAKIGVWIHDFSTLQIYWSPEHYEIFDTKEFDGTVEGFMKFVHPDDISHILEQFDNSVKNGVSYQPEYRIITNSGETRWIGNLGQVEHDENGKPLRFLSTVFDITERKYRELNLAFLANVQKDFAPLSSAIEIMKVAGERIAEYLNVPRCNFVEINETADTAEVVYDYHAPDLSSLIGVYKLSESYTGEERRKLAAETSLVINDVRDEARTAEAVANFAALDIRALANAPYSSHGQWEFSIAVQNNQPRQWRTDEIELLGELAERIYIRLERARAEEKLRESEERFRALFNSIDEGFCIIEVIFDEDNKPVDYRFEQINPAFSRLSGLPESAVGKTMLEFEPDLENFWFETYGKVVLTGEPARFENEAAPMNRWFDVFASRLGNGDSRRVAIVFNNITDRKTTELQREKLLVREQELRREAEATNRAKEEFLAMLSHELRTPLNSIFGWTQILETSDFDREKTKRGIEVIARNVRLQNALIEDLLDVSRIVSGKMRLESEVLPLISVAQDAVDAIRPVAEQRSIKIEADFDADIGEINGDKFRLQQVFGNILTNAVKFTSESSTIFVSLKSNGETAKFTVKDSGIGISEELLPHVFDRFRQADGGAKRQFGGLGLGLTIVKNLVELHGGAVSAFSDGENQGATFVVELPLRPQLDSPLPKIFPAVEKNAGDVNLKDGKILSGSRILAVDDDDSSLGLIQFVLEDKGANVTCAESAKEALQKLETGEYDLLISDLGMPGMDGYDLIRAVRQSENARVREIPAIALSGYVSAEDRERVALAGFQTHLPKPMDLDHLSIAVFKLLQT